MSRYDIKTSDGEAQEIYLLKHFYPFSLNHVTLLVYMMQVYMMIPDIGMTVRVFANGPGDLGSIPG